MNFNIKEIFTAFMVLFAVIDIVGNIPIIIDKKKSWPYSIRKSVDNCGSDHDCISFLRTKFT